MTGPVCAIVRRRRGEGDNQIETETKNLSTLAIYCADIGSIRRGNFGWAAVDDTKQYCGTDISGLVDNVVDVLCAGRKVALGFECPLWVPVAACARDLTSGRAVDGNKPWSAAAGASALAAGLTETSWILQHITQRLRQRGCTVPRPYLRWDEFARSESGVFLWEAFVTGDAKSEAKGKGKGHIADALTACNAFAGLLPDPTEASLPEPPYEARSLIGATVLWAGWSDDLRLLRAKCLVVKPTTPLA